MLERSTEAFRFFEQNYWNYYRELEDDFLSLRRYVSISSINFQTFSVEILKLYQAVCSEIDVIGKALAKEVNPEYLPNDNKNNILKWWYTIQDSLLITERDIITGTVEEKRLSDYKCILLDNLRLTPWNHFHVDQYLSRNNRICHRLSEGCSTPTWWSDYNKVKHSRTSFSGESNEESNYCKANLGNLCSAFAALYILETAYMNNVGTRNDLEAFYDYSILFVKRRMTTTDEIQAMFDQDIELSTV